MVELQLKYENEYGLWTCSYEALLDNTKKIVQEILDFLELDYNNQILNNMISKSSFEFITGRKRGQMNKRSFYRKGVAGDWKNYFSSQDREKFKRIASDILVRLGYEKDYSW